MSNKKTTKTKEPTKTYYTLRSVNLSTAELLALHVTGDKVEVEVIGTDLPVIILSKLNRILASICVNG